jgi:hypothetical protein
MKYNDGVYAIDSDSQVPSDKNILTWMVCQILLDRVKDIDCLS